MSAAKIAIATGPGLNVGSTVLLGAFTGPRAVDAAGEACQQHAGRVLNWQGVLGGWECRTGPAGSGYAVRVLDADVAYVGEPPSPHPVTLELGR